MFKNILVALALLLAKIPVSSAQTTVFFAGINWSVRSGTGGPGPNNWSDSGNSVWVDGSGALHLKIRKIGNVWYCSEIYAQESFCYGEYRFYVASNVENYDKNVVVGLFLYENDSREIDIEFSRWGWAANPVGWYTIQPPPYSASNQQNFDLNLTGDYSTHKFVWSSSDIFFQSYHGHYPTLPSPNFLIKQWTYTGNNNPPVGNERLHLNFWLLNGLPPTDQQEVELVVKAVAVPSPPDQPSPIAGTTPVCQGQNGVNYSVSNVSGLTYDWSYSGVGFGIAAGQGTHSITADFSPQATSGILTATPFDACGTAGTPRTFDVTVNLCTASREVEFIKSLKAFPNPTNGRLHIEIEQQQGLHWEVTLLDLNGCEVYTNRFWGRSGNVLCTIEMENYPKGVYILCLRSDKGSIYKKIILI